MEESPWYQQVVFPALLRHARTTYGKAMRAALDEAGFDDIPGNGLYVIGGMALREGVILRYLQTMVDTSQYLPLHPVTPRSEDNGATLRALTPTQ